MIQQKWKKVNFYNSALKPLPRLPYRSKQLSLWDVLIFATFGTSRSTRKCHRFHFWLSQIEGNWWEKTTRHPLQLPVHPPTPPKHLWTLQNTLRHHKHIPQSTTNSFDFYKALVRQSKRHLSCQEMSGGTLWEMRVSEDVCWVSGIFVSVKAMSGLSWECLEISEGDWGVSSLEVVEGEGGLKGVSGCIFPSVSFNFGKSQMRSWHFLVD